MQIHVWELCEYTFTRRMNKITKLLEKHVPFLRRMYFIDKNDTIAEQDECEENYKQLLLSIKK